MWHSRKGKITTENGAVVARGWVGVRGWLQRGTREILGWPKRSRSWQLYYRLHRSKLTELHTYNGLIFLCVYLSKPYFNYNRIYIHCRKLGKYKTPRKNRVTQSTEAYPFGICYKRAGITLLVFYSLFLKFKFWYLRSVSSYRCIRSFPQQFAFIFFFF